MNAFSFNNIDLKDMNRIGTRPYELKIVQLWV